MDAYNTARTSSFTSSAGPRFRLLSAAGVVLVLLLALLGFESTLAQSKGKAKASKTPPPPTESEYSARFRGAEAALVGLDRPYLLLDLANSRLRLKLRGVIVRDFKFKLLSDPNEPKAFEKHAEVGDTVTKSMVRLHVFESERQLNDTVLGIVSQATTAPATLIQRYRPKHMSVTYSDRLALDVYAADVGGQPTSWRDDLAEKLRLMADGLMGGERLKIQIARDDAMSFYGVCREAPPLLIMP